VTRTKARLTELLLAGSARAGAAARDISQDSAWPKALELAREWKVTPQLSARLQNIGVKLGAEETGTLRREFLRAHANSAQRAARSIEAIRELERAGIPVAAFKGLAAMAMLYGGPKHRTIGDGDLLILRRDLVNVLTCLGRKGWARKGAETLDEYMKFVENAPRFAGNQAIALYGEDGSEIDLHWQVAGSGLGVEELLSRMVKAQLSSFEIPVVDAKDGFLLTVHHAIREDLGIESMCRDLLDACLWCEYMERFHQLEEGMRWAVRSGAQVAALTVTSLLSGYDDTTAAARAAGLLGAAMSGRELRSAARLVELFHYQLGKGRLGRDVMFLVHWRPWRQIANGFGQDWAGYRRSMETLEGQLGEDHSLLKRASQFSKSIPGLHALRMARELALVKYRGR